MTTMGLVSNQGLRIKPMNSNKNNRLSIRTKIWMGVGAYILTGGLSNVANASAPHNLNPEIVSNISTSGATFTASEMLQASTEGDKDGKTDDKGKDKKGDEGGESGEGGEG